MPKNIYSENVTPLKRPLRIVGGVITSCKTAGLIALRASRVNAADLARDAVLERDEFTA